MRGLPLLMLVLTVSWIIFIAEAFVEGNIHWVILSIGQLTNNVDSNLVDLNRASSGQRLVALIGRGLTMFLWSLAFLGGLRRVYNRYWDLPCILLTISPLLMLAGNSYGGEMLFRAYFFSLPFMAFFAAALLYTRPFLGRSWRTAAISIVVTGAMLFGFCFAYYGKERMNYFTENEVAAAQYLFNTAPAGSLLIEGSWNYPTRYERYELYSYETLITRFGELGNDSLDRVQTMMSDRQYPATYLILTRSQKVYGDMMGLGSLASFEQALRQSGDFKAIYANDDATIYTLANRLEGSGQ
jgi:hypothetical protein